MLVVGVNAEAQMSNASIVIRRDTVEVVLGFKYLGTIFTSDGILNAEIAHRAATASSAFALKCGHPTLVIINKDAVFPGNCYVNSTVWG